jgi:predicted extracellular nuclease
MGKTTLRLVSMNLENLFTPGQNFYGSSYSQDEYAEKIDWIASRIAEADAHVAALVELGEDSGIATQDLLAAINAKEPGSPIPFQHEYRADAEPGSTVIRNAIISRFPLSEASSLKSYPQKFKVDLLTPETDAGDPANWITVPSKGFGRPIAHALVETGGTPFHLFVAHLKSKRPKTAKHDGYNEPIGMARSAIQRNVEAAALRFYFDKFLPDQYAADSKVATILAGDLNDTPGSVPVQNIRGPFDSTPGPSSTWSEPDKRRLLNCARLHLKVNSYEDKLYSYVYEEQFSLLDHVFVTEHLAKKFKRLEIYNDHVLRHRQLSSPTDEEKQWKSRVSDHGILVVEFTRML